jgi:integrase
MRVKVVGINCYKDRHGKERMYWRRKGAPAIALDVNLSGAALAAKVKELEEKYLAPKARVGTLRQLVIEYKTNADHWQSLRERTRKDYERVFKWLGESLDVPTADWGTVDVVELRDKARKQHEPKFANQVVTTLKMVFQHGLEYGLVRENPAKDVSKATGGNSRDNRPCTPQEALALIGEAPSHLRPAIAIAIYTGLRLGDVALLSKKADLGDWLETLQGKTRKLVVLGVCEDLRWIIDGIPKNDSVTVCVKEDGTPWAYEGLKTAFQRHRDSLLKRGLIGPGVTFHGLRHTTATILEGNGFDDRDTQHQLGHGPKSVSGLYGMSADRKKLLRDMALKIEEVLRAARSNVVRFENRGH